METRTESYTDVAKLVCSHETPGGRQRASTLTGPSHKSPR